MANFYAEIMGGRGKASRTGSKSSGIWSHTRGWDSGIEVNCYVLDGKDFADVYITKGSNGYGKWKLGTLEEDGTFIPSEALCRIFNDRIKYLEDGLSTLSSAKIESIIEVRKIAREVLNGNSE